MSRVKKHYRPQDLQWLEPSVREFLAMFGRLPDAEEVKVWAEEQKYVITKNTALGVIQAAAPPGTTPSAECPACHRTYHGWALLKAEYKTCHCGRRLRIRSTIRRKEEQTTCDDVSKT